MNNHEEPNDIGEECVRSERGSVTVVGEKAGNRIVKGARSEAKGQKPLQPFLGTNRQLQILVQAIPDIVYFKDVEGRNLIVNKAFEKLVELKQEEIIGKTDKELFPSDLAKQCQKSDEETLKKGKPLRFEEQMIDEQGQTWFFETIKAPMRDENGKVFGIVGASRDITQQKKSELEQRQSNELFRKLFRLMVDPLVIVDGHGKILEISDSVKDITGFSREDLLGKNFLRIKALPTKSKAIILKNLFRRLRGEEIPRYEVEILAKDGSKRYSEVNALKIEYAGKPAVLAVFHDITEHKKAEEKYRMLFEEAMDAIFLGDTETGILIDCNRAASELVGREKSELIGKHQKILHPPQDDEGEFSRTFAQHLKNKEGQVLETKVITKKGKLKDVAIKANKFELEGKEVIQGVFRDITERKKTEEMLGREHDFLQALMDNIPDPIFFKDTESRFLRVNKVSCPGLGVSSPEEAVGMTDFDFSPKELAKQFYADDQKVMRTGKPLVNKEEVMIDKIDKKWNLVTKVPIRDKNGKVTGLVGIARNITKLKETEEKLRRYSERLEELVDERTRKLRESEERYRDLIEKEKDIIYSLNKDGTITFASPATITTLNYRPEELLGKNFMDLIPEDWKKKTWSDFENLIKIGDLTAETVLLSRDGQPRFVEYSSTVLKDGDETVGTQGIVRDITKRKQLEERLLTAERLAGIGETAAMVGHDLRNPLQAITIAIDVLKNSFDWPNTQSSQNEEIINPIPEDTQNKVKDDAHKLVDERAEMISIIGDAVSYANKIVSDLQDYARPLKLDVTPTKVRSLVEDTLSIVTIPDNIKVILKIPEDFPEITIDPNLLKRVFSNLITNASQAMPNGGKLTIAATKTNETALIHLQDTGVGILKENLPKLFKPLFTTKAKGQGFGLAVCKRVIESHGGTISVESEVGKGSTFIIRIPIKSPPGLKSGA